MIHSSWVWLAWVLRTRSGMATFNDAMAAETAPSAMQTTVVTRERFTCGLPARTFVFLIAPKTREYSFYNMDDRSYQEGIFLLFVLRSWGAPDHRPEAGGPTRTSSRSGARLPRGARARSGVDGDDHRPPGPLDRRRLRLLQRQGPDHQCGRDRGHCGDGRGPGAGPHQSRAATASRVHGAGPARCHEFRSGQGR